MLFSEPHPRVRHAAGNLARGVASIAAAVLLFEGGLRIAGVKYSASLYTSDPVLGWALRPRSEGWSVDEGINYVRINSDGMRDREHTVAKPPRTVRIALLGDSATEARQVALEKTFAAALERELNRAGAFGGRKVEILNFGVPGYSLVQQLLQLRERVWKYSPDIVIECFYTGNGVLNMHPTLNLQPAGAPFFRYRGSRLELDDSRIRDLRSQEGRTRLHDRLADIVSRVRILQMLSEARLTVKLWLPKRKPAASANDLPDNYASVFPYRPPGTPAMAEAWKMTEGVLRMMRDDVRARGVEFWIVTLPMAGETLPDLSARAQLLKRLGTDTLFYPDMRIRDLCTAEGIPCLVLAPALADFAVRNKVHLNGFPNTRPDNGHWNEAGHEIAGRMIAQRLREGR